MAKTYVTVCLDGGKLVATDLFTDEKKANDEIIKFLGGPAILEPEAPAFTWSAIRGRRVAFLSERSVR
jgi:hypothetical protein